MTVNKMKLISVLIVLTCLAGHALRKLTMTVRGKHHLEEVEVGWKHTVGAPNQGLQVKGVFLEGKT